MEQFDTLPLQCRHIEHMHEGVFLLQLLMEQFDTLSIQCRHIGHMHEGVWFRKIIIDKMTAVRT